MESCLLGTPTTFFFFLKNYVFAHFHGLILIVPSEDRREIGWEREEAQHLLMFSGFSGRVSVSMRAFFHKDMKQPAKEGSAAWRLCP